MSILELHDEASRCNCGIGSRLSKIIFPEGEAGNESLTDESAPRLLKEDYWGDEESP